MDVYSTLFITAKTWEQPGYPSIDEWINKLQNIQTAEYFLALKVNELLSHEKKWRKLKCLILNRRTQSEKAVYYVIPTV